jgi:hypothetical protein
MCGVLPNPILLPGQRTRLIQPCAAPQLRPRRNAGSLLLIRQRAAVPPGGGAEAGAAEQLRQCAWVPGAGVTAPALFAAPHIPYPIAAPPTSERGIKTAARGRAKRAAAALVPGFSKSFHRRHYAISDLSQNRANARAFQEEPAGNCARPLPVKKRMALKAWFWVLAETSLNGKSLARGVGQKRSKAPGKKSNSGLQ